MSCDFENVWVHFLTVMGGTGCQGHFFSPGRELMLGGGADCVWRLSEQFSVLQPNFVTTYEQFLFVSLLLRYGILWMLLLLLIYSTIVKKKSSGKYCTIRTQL